MHHTGDNVRNPFGAKVVSISVAAAQSDALVNVCWNATYNHTKDNGQNPDEWNIFFNEIFPFEC
jgi:hypothetical protein